MVKTLIGLRYQPAASMHEREKQSNNSEQGYQCPVVPESHGVVSAPCVPFIKNKPAMQQWAASFRQLSLEMHIPVHSPLAHIPSIIAGGYCLPLHPLINPYRGTLLHQREESRCGRVQLSCKPSRANPPRSTRYDRWSGIPGIERRAGDEACPRIRLRSAAKEQIRIAAVTARETSMTEVHK